MIKNHRGEIISEPKKLKALLAQEYKHRLRARPVRPDFKNLEIRKKKLFEMKLKYASENKSKLWTKFDLERALRSLKVNRSRDPEGLVNEIFKKNVIGSDLKTSLLLLFNKLKEQQLIPTFMNNANKLGLSWAKLSYQLGFACTGINIFCLILINMKLLDT